MLFAPDDDGRDIFAHPTGFTRIVSDAGSHNSHDVVYYRMTPPPGYESVGICFTNGELPNANNYWCVNRKYLQVVDSVEAWSDQNAHWMSYNGSLNAATFARPAGSPPATTDLASDDNILILPPTYLSVQDLANERAYALVGQQAMLPVLPFDPPDPPDDPKITSGATTTYGLGRVAIVPYTAVPADAWYGQQAINSPFYFIASEPYWECVEVRFDGRRWIHYLVHHDRSVGDAGVVVHGFHLHDDWMRGRGQIRRSFRQSNRFIHARVLAHHEQKHNSFLLDNVDRDQKLPQAANHMGLVQTNPDHRLSH